MILFSVRPFIRTRDLRIDEYSPRRKSPTEKMIAAQERRVDKEMKKGDKNDNRRT